MSYQKSLDNFIQLLQLTKREGLQPHQVLYARYQPWLMRIPEIGKEIDSLHFLSQGKAFQREVGWKKRKLRKSKLETTSESCWQIKKPSKELGRAEGSITSQGLCTTGLELFFPEDGSCFPKTHWCLRGGPVNRISAISLHLQSTPKDVKFPYKLFTKTIPPVTAMQKAKNCRWVYTTHGIFSYLKRTISKMFIKSRANYWIYHKKCLLAQHFVGWSD